MSDKKAKFSIIDGLIVVALLGIIAGGIWFFANNRGGEAGYITYVVELAQAHPGYAQNITIGGEIRDSVRNYFLGHVADVRYEPAVQINFNHYTQEFEQTLVPDRYDIYITIQGPATLGHSEIRVHGQPIRVGMDKFLRMHSFAGIGVVVGIDTGE